MYSSAVVPLVTLLQSTTHASKQLLHIMNEMNSVTPSGKAATAANLKPFATVTHPVALQNRSNLKATFNSNHDIENK